MLENKTGPLHQPVQQDNSRSAVSTVYLWINWCGLLNPTYEESLFNEQMFFFSLFVKLTNSDILCWIWFILLIPSLWLLIEHIGLLTWHQSSVDGDGTPKKQKSRCSCDRSKLATWTLCMPDSTGGNTQWPLQPLEGDLEEDVGDKTHCFHKPTQVRQPQVRWNLYCKLVRALESNCRWVSFNEIKINFSLFVEPIQFSPFFIEFDLPSYFLSVTESLPIQSMLSDHQLSISVHLVF